MVVFISPQHTTYYSVCSSWNLRPKFTNDSQNGCSGVYHLQCHSSCQQPEVHEIVSLPWNLKNRIFFILYLKLNEVWYHETYIYLWGYIIEQDVILIFADVEMWAAFDWFKLAISLDWKFICSDYSLEDRLPQHWDLLFALDYVELFSRKEWTPNTGVDDQIMT